MGLNLYLTRHAETVWHAENRYAGRTDVALTDHGVQQAARLGGWAAGASLDAVWCSPLTRSHQTAVPAASGAGVPLHVDERLVELDFGVAEGLTTAELGQHDPAALAAFLSDPVGSYFPGGEDPVDAVARYAAVLDELAPEAGDADATVLVVGHNTMIRLTLCHLLGLDLAAYRSVFPRLDNCALTELRVDGGAVALLRLNCAAGEWT
ncbi:hypothetical protein GCM10023340_44070 [Nocardioides marinquilinus]|uniref:Histidine phosphatase family protein n=1 Tax=Nocardioides marinquilinus TaxID=1210400 RepID=A0ABP9Q6C9_9ACTN